MFGLSFYSVDTARLGGNRERQKGYLFAQGKIYLTVGLALVRPKM
jgi:hypothetical protein